MFGNTSVLETSAITSRNPDSHRAVDADIAPLEWLFRHMQEGLAGALVTIVGIDGGAPRPVGTQMAVLADGRYFGQISGGCVEPAIAAEVLLVLANGQDTVLRFGRGAKAIDIQFPCGGGVEVLVHLPQDMAPFAEALTLSKTRQPFVLLQSLDGATSAVTGEQPLGGWHGEQFARLFLPRTRALLIGRGQELEATAKTALVAGYDVHIASPSLDSLAVLEGLCTGARHLTTPEQPWDLPIDSWTATVVLFHDHAWETAILMRALAADGFYLGALGSRKTHRLRIDALAARGADPVAIARIKGPIGLIPQARDPGTLAISILAEIARERAQRWA